MDDLISRQAVLDGIEELKKSPWATDTRGTGFEYLITESLDTVRDLVVKQMPSVENKGEWIPITYRPMTEEEKEHYSEQIGCAKEDLDAMLNCRLPDDGEEVLITVFGEVETDIFYRDGDWYSFENRDIEDVRAWMPLPEPAPYKSEKIETCKGCLEPCIMYEPDMRGCKKKG